MAACLATPTAWVTAAVCGLSILASGWTVQSASGAGQRGESAKAVRRARDALVAEAVKGKLTPKVIELYYRYAEQRARTAAPADKVTDDFWKWFDANPAIRERILAGMDCAYAGHIVGRLAELRSEFGGDVDRYSQLVIAFALVYGRAGDESIRQWKWVAKGRPVPPMVESFRYYMAHDREMLFPLEATPWPLLVHPARLAPSRKALKKNPEAKGTVNVVHVQVAGAYVKTLRKLGKKGEAARLKAKIAELMGKDK